MQEPREKLQELLQQLFRADAADLDFGIYRIINYRREQIQGFIDNELPSIVNEALDANPQIESDRQELNDLKQRIRSDLGDAVLDADGNLINDTYKDAPLVKKYLDVKKQVGSPQSLPQRENAVYHHLYTFFSRYFENGDFIPRRRYSQNESYAVPYNGEEIYLHWANRDQYYVKSGEHFSTYKFKSNKIIVTFDLQDANIEKDNVKGKKRFFIPIPAETEYDQETGEVSIPFEYRPLTDEEKKRYSGNKQQEKIIDCAEPEIIKHFGDYDVQSELGREVGDETFLKKHLRTYTRLNTSDFFIHKKLESFLSSELDIYMKNEVLPMSSFLFKDNNFQDGNLTKVGWLETAQLVQEIASKIIAFLSTIEEFQKHLWLKKKFVLSTEYCMTLDRVPESLYEEITKNKTQLEEWKELFAIHEIDNDNTSTDYTEPISVNFLKSHPNLVLDTCHFNSGFKDKLLTHFDDLDNETDGLLIHGENFQALNLITKKYRRSIKVIYIDPPYNTNASAILYKNDYKDSSWMSLMSDRISVTRELLTDKGIFCAAIDDVEAVNLRHFLQHLFGKDNEHAVVAVCSNPGGRKRPSNFAPAHEYAMFFGSSNASQVGRLKWTKEQLKKYSEEDEKGKFGWRPLRKSGGPNTHREASPRLFYPLFVNDKHIRIPKLKWNDVNREYEVLESLRQGEKDVWPINSDGEDMTWGFGVETLKEKLLLSELSAKTDTKGNVRIQFKRYLNKDGTLPTTWWGSKEYSATAYGTRILTHMLGNALTFLFPKSIHLVQDCLRASSLYKNDTVLDYFGGSGTTAHATVNLNREDEGNRKYILVEMGHHFDTALMPRIKKAVYAEKWKDAKPVSRDSRLSHIIKYQRIESYEDTLNNIEFSETEDEITLLKDEHELSYLLGNKTRESSTLLNIEKLRSPFDYQLKIVKDMQIHTQVVDIAETFNYLLGICVNSQQYLYDDDRRYVIYHGTRSGSQNVVVIWRKTAGWGKEDWEQDCRFIEAQKLTEGATEVYVNTKSLVPDVTPLDPLFNRLMFE